MRRIITIILVILIFVASVALIIILSSTQDDIVSPSELESYSTDYLAKYNDLVDENIYLISKNLSNFYPYNTHLLEIKGIISRSHGAVLFFNFSNKDNSRTIIKISMVNEPIEYYVWPRMNQETSSLEKIMIAPGTIILSHPVRVSHVLLYISPKANVVYTGKDDGFLVSDEGAVITYGQIIYKGRMVLKGSNHKEDWSKTQADLDALDLFLWNSIGILNSSDFNKLNQKYRIPILLNRIAYRIRHGKYIDSPYLFEEDYNELKKLNASKDILVRVMKDYYESQKNMPLSFTDKLLTGIISCANTIVTGVIVGIIVTILAYYIKNYLTSKKEKIKNSKRIQLE